MNPYETLGVDKTATPDTIKAAYRGKAKKAHPDAGGSPQAFSDLLRARAVLLSPRSRAQFDRTGKIEDAPIDNENAEAMNLVMEIIVGTIKGRGNSPFTYDLLGDVKKTLSGEIKNIDRQRGSFQDEVRTLLSLAKRFSAKKGKQNAISPMLEARARQREEQVADADREIRKRETAIKIADGHVFAYDATTQYMGLAYQMAQLPMPGGFR